MHRGKDSLSLRILAACVLVFSALTARAEQVWNPDFLRKLPRISTSAELDRLLDSLNAEEDRSHSTASPSDPFIYPIRPFKGGYAPLLIEDSAGKLEKYAVWLQKGSNGRSEKLVLVLPTMHDTLFDKEGYMPFDATLKKKIMKAKGITEEGDYEYVMKNYDTSSGRIMVRAVVAGDLLGHYLENGQWSGTRADPLVESYYQQVLTFTDATAAAASASPRAIVSTDAVKGSRVSFFEYE